MLKIFGPIRDAINRKVTIQKIVKTKECFAINPSANGAN
jgi:hypothetical protein